MKHHSYANSHCCLQKTVIDRRWKEWGDSHSKHTSRANKTKKLLMDEEGFWDKLVELKNILLPVYTLLRKVRMCMCIGCSSSQELKPRLPFFALLGNALARLCICFANCSASHLQKPKGLVKETALLLN
jgi:hypothetical protein